MENETDVIYIHPQKRIVSQKRKYFYLGFTGAFFLFIGLLSGTPTDNWSGFRKRIHKCGDFDLTFCAFSLSAQGDFKRSLICFDSNSYRFLFFWQKPL